MEVWQAIALAVTGNLLAIGALGWLAQKLILSSLDRAADVRRNQLKIDADRQVTELRNSLERVATEHRIRLTNLHEKRL